MEEIREALLLIPYIVQHQGVKINDLCRKFKLERKKILHLLETISLCGLPEYTPYDLIDVDIQDDQVKIKFADFLSRPVSLSSSEAVAILMGAELLKKSNLELIDSMKSVINKVRGALSHEAIKQVDQHFKLVGMTVEPNTSEEILKNLDYSIKKNVTGKLVYHGLGKDQITEREVDPYEMVLARSTWYLIGFCHQDKVVKKFRIDRIKEFTPTEKKFKKPKDLKIENLINQSYIESPDDVTVKILYSKEIAWLIKDKWSKRRIEEFPDGKCILTLKVNRNNYPWLIKQCVLPYRDRAKILEPPNLTKKFLEELKRIQKRYD